MCRRDRIFFDHAQYLVVLLLQKCKCRWADFPFPTFTIFFKKSSGRCSVWGFKNKSEGCTGRFRDLILLAARSKICLLTTRGTWPGSNTATDCLKYFFAIGLTRRGVDVTGMRPEFFVCLWGGGNFSTIALHSLPLVLTVQRHSCTWSRSRNRSFERVWPNQSLSHFAPL